ncbi:MAG: fibrobacter succinogenes major paralogous domain-containing protein [Fibrobacter sp.]|nr:fibrobacter succinogenes major paralogous domain-containing protein [Fibrobacter sp.]
MNLGRSIGKCLVSAVVVGSMLFAACSDDSSASARNDENSTTVVTDEVDSRDDLPNCNSKREGERYYVIDEDADYLCSDYSWKNLNDKGEGSKDSDSDEKISSSSSEKAEMSSDSEKNSSSSKDVLSSSSSEIAVSFAIEVSSAIESSSDVQPLSSSSRELESSSSEIILDSVTILEPCSDGETSMYDSIPVTCQNNKWYATGVEFDTMTDSRDGNVYKTVKIGQQLWMAENLNYAYTEIAYSYDTKYEDSTSWCYKGSADSCAKYGRLYTWSAVMDSAGVVDEKNSVPNRKADGTEFSAGCGYYIFCTPNTPHRGICPEGWHVPTDAEYDTLLVTVGDTAKAGIYLKSVSGWSEKSSAKGIDLYGFSIVPSGFRGVYGVFSQAGDYSHLWTASMYDGNTTWSRVFGNSTVGVLQKKKDKFNGFSLRCVKD